MLTCSGCRIARFGRADHLNNAETGALSNQDGSSVCACVCVCVFLSAEFPGTTLLPLCLLNTPRLPYSPPPLLLLSVLPYVVANSLCNLSLLGLRPRAPPVLTFKP